VGSVTMFQLEIISPLLARFLGENEQKLATYDDNIQSSSGLEIASSWATLLLSF